jgi:hypothetical protein
MKKTVLKFLLVLLAFGVSRVEAQDIVYRDTFFNGVPATTAQIARWTAFQAKLTANLAYTGILISGTNNTTGIECTDAAIAKLYAAAVRTASAYTSPTTNGHVWSICNRYLGEVGLIHLRNVVVQIAQTLVILFDQESERVTKTGVA